MRSDALSKAVHFTLCTFDTLLEILVLLARRNESVAGSGEVRKVLRRWVFEVRRIQIFRSVLQTIDFLTV